MKKDIKELSLGELKKVFVSLGEQEYRAREIFQAIYKEKIKDFENITTLPKYLRNKLNENFCMYSFKKVSEIVSEDGTKKYLFKMNDGSLIETVLIRQVNKFSKESNTICISTQVGCSLGCKFCATGHMGLIRNLTTSEIVEQFLTLDNETKINNIVFMGMGEPLLNYKNVKRAIEIITDKYGIAFGKRRITISSSGISNKIYTLTDDMKSINLAISLHSAIQNKRNKIMPGLINEPILRLLKSLQYYSNKIGNAITIEYLLIKNFNDTINDAEQLANFAKKIKFVKINLMNLNKVPFSTLEPSIRAIEFQKYLLSRGIRTTLRKSRGFEISAACGQLATKLTS
jgi:23S rRNA (adenine2503-C2)-methyltransferase